MGHNHVTAVRVEDIFAYMDGEASPTLADLIRQCPDCAKTVREYAPAQERLRHALYRFECPAAHVLGEYERALLPPDQHTALTAHLRHCLRCAAELAMLREFMRTEHPVELGATERLRRVIAILVARPMRGALAGVRGAGNPNVHLYQADGLTIALEVTACRPGGRAIISGLLQPSDIEPTDFAGRPVRLLGDGSHAVAHLDEMGAFSFESVTPGSYALEIELAAQVVAIETLIVE